MPEIVSDIVDVYVFRRLNARVQFLLLQRRADVAMPHTWQGFHAPIAPGERTLDAARRSVRELAALNVSRYYSADYINQFYDEYRDVLVLAPVVAVNVSPQAPISLAHDFRDCAWFERDEAIARLPFSGQRWAIRHIDDLMSIGEREAELYRLEPHEVARPITPAVSVPNVTTAAPIADDDPALVPSYAAESVAMTADDALDAPFVTETPDTEEVREAISESDALTDDEEPAFDESPIAEVADAARDTDDADVADDNDDAADDPDPLESLLDEPEAVEEDVSRRFDRFRLRPRSRE